MAGRKRIYKDEKLESRCFRLSKKYEMPYILAFIDILRDKRETAIDFVEKERK